MNDAPGLTRDGFLGGRVQVWQPAKGYRAATDPVFLAAACPARPGETVLELGCGAGVASLCLAARVGGLHLTAVERNTDYAALARRNAVENGADMEVFDADLAALPADLRTRSFDHVIANPPYFTAGTGTAAADFGRERANREDTPLAVWIDTARARLKPGGWLTLIHMAERLPDLLAVAQGGFGAISVLPLAARHGRPAKRILIRARKGAAAPFSLLPPFVIHAAGRHERDGEDLSPEACGVLRDAAAIPWG